MITIEIDFNEVQRLCSRIEAAVELQAAQPGQSQPKPPKGIFKRGKRSQQKPPDDDLAYVTVTVSEWLKWVNSKIARDAVAFGLANTIRRECAGKTPDECVTIWSNWNSWCSILNSRLEKRSTGCARINSRITHQVMKTSRKY